MTRFKSVNACTILFTLILAGTCQAAERKLINLFSVKGDCTGLIIEGATLPCKGILLQTDFDDGRIGFYFMSDDGTDKVITFTGLGPQQKVVSDNARLQPVDGVVFKEGGMKATGECYFENPYVGPAKIECEAQTNEGSNYSAYFLTDGEEPEIKEME